MVTWRKVFNLLPFLASIEAFAWFITVVRLRGAEEPWHEAVVTGHLAAWGLLGSFFCLVIGAWLAGGGGRR
jgi:hypothetical protein